MKADVNISVHDRAPSKLSYIDVKTKSKNVESLLICFKFDFVNKSLPIITTENEQYCAVVLLSQRSCTFKYINDIQNQTVLKFV